MKAFLINLPECLDRKEYASSMLVNAGFDVVLVQAIWGKNLQYPNTDYSSLSYRLMHGKKDNYGEVGCYLSHIKALKQFLNTEDEYAFICEDDISVDPNINKVLQAALNEQKRWDILRISGLRSGTPIKVCSLDEKYALYVNLTRQTGSGAYLVNRKAAKKLAEVLLPMKLPLDHAYDREWLWGLRALMVYPVLANQRNGFESQIKARKHYKLPAYIRYLTVFPYRTVNEISRVVYRLFQVAIQRYIFK